MTQNVPPPNHGKTFQDGYIDGYQSVRPGTLPSIPSYAIPIGKTPYQWGFMMGEEDASR
jgi:hypothetical protein